MYEADIKEIKDLIVDILKYVYINYKKYFLTNTKVYKIVKRLTIHNFDIILCDNYDDIIYFLENINTDYDKYIIFIKSLLKPEFHDNDEVINKITDQLLNIDMFYIKQI